MLYADDAGIVSRSQEGLTRMMTTIVEVFGALSAEYGSTVGMRNRGLARKPPPRRTLAVGNSEDSGNVVTEDKVKGKGKSKGREGGGSKARAQDGSNGLDAQEEKGAT
ncbi:unnamed protein product, partial [Ascophyllum nodosum]